VDQPSSPSALTLMRFFMRRTTTAVVLGSLLGVGQVFAQGTPDTVAHILELHQIIERRGSELGPRIWPGFRPDTIPTLYVIAHRAKLLVQWRHSWPTGFTPLASRSDAAFAGTEMLSLPSGKLIAFMTVDSTMSPGLVLGTSIHEAFHSFERSMMAEDRTFGSWENAMLVSSYPAFDEANETAFAVEAQALRRALAGSNREEAARYAREFLALREARQRRLSENFVTFENKAELNEGLAQYALIAGLMEVGRLEGGPWPSRARHEAEVESRVLDNILGTTRQSIRRRFYATGSAMARVLDQLNPAWKTELISANLNLQQMLARASGYRGTDVMGEGWARESERRFEHARPAAADAIAQLRAQRASQADSVTSASGLRLTLETSALERGTLQWCGFDPQNTLQTGDGRTVHMRFLRVCAGSAATLEFGHPVVQHEQTGVFSTAIDSTTLTIQGEKGPVTLKDQTPVRVDGLRLAADGITIDAKHAELLRSGQGLKVTLLAY
jgi:hypothetical protein